MSSATIEPVFEPNRLRAVRRSGLHSVRSAEHLDRLARFAAELTGAPVALVSIVDGESQVFAGMAGTVGDGARQTTLDYSVCRTVVDDNEPLVLNELAVDPTFAAHPARVDLDVQAYCGVPIRDRDGYVLGSFCVIDDVAHEWTSKTVRLLERLAELVTDTVEVNIDYAELVADLQKRLIPVELPDGPGGSVEGRYRPVPDSEMIGGDFFDAVLGPDGSVDVIVGDVVGHGTGSTQAAAQLRAAARAVLAGERLDPADVINRIAAACNGLPGCAAAALVVVHVDPDGRTVRWARAGAMPPIVVRNEAEVLHAAPGPPIGYHPVERSAETVTTLAEGDRFMIFTDGLVERRGESLDVGLARLAQIACGAADIDGLLEACPVGQQDDDIALVVYTAGHKPAAT